MNKNRTSLSKMVAIFFGVFFSFGFINVAIADDICKAKCETQSKSCVKGCNGDTDCVLNCSDKRDKCVEGCGG
ncbi:MAG: hypothetical protein WC785_05615 [Tatlockia sp.]